MVNMLFYNTFHIKVKLKKRVFLQKYFEKKSSKKFLQKKKICPPLIFVIRLLNYNFYKV